MPASEEMSPSRAPGPMWGSTAAAKLRLPNRLTATVRSKSSRRASAKRSLMLTPALLMANRGGPITPTASATAPASASASHTSTSAVCTGWATWLRADSIS